MQIIARADGAASTPANGPASNGATLTESAKIQCKKVKKNPAALLSMIRKRGSRFSEKIMLHQNARA
jgi:hypothetical protein